MLNFTRTERQHYKALRQELIDAYHYVLDHSNKPRDTCALLIDRVGKENAVEIVALMIATKGTRDGRISRSNRMWAEMIEPLAIEIAHGCDLYYCDAIHPCHMDMIADAMRRI